jgi:hypothetical protein
MVAKRLVKIKTTAAATYPMLMGRPALRWPKRDLLFYNPEGSLLNGRDP